jgi:hypothetical protein
LCKCVLPPGDDPIAVNKYIKFFSPRIKVYNFREELPWFILSHQQFGISAAGRVNHNSRKQEIKLEL